MKITRREAIAGLAALPALAAGVEASPPRFICGCFQVNVDGIVAAWTVFYDENMTEIGRTEAKITGPYSFEIACKP